MSQRNQLVSPVLLLAVAALAAVVTNHSQADPPAAQPAGNVLQQLSDETQQLYLQSRHSMVRVQLPTPQWLEDFNNKQEFLKKWGPLMDPVVRARFIQEQEGALGALHQPPTTAPTNAPALTATTQPLTEVRRTPETGLALFAVGLIVDDQGHAVFPVFVDRKYVGDSELSAVTGDNEATTAKFVGSDALTNLTVLQLATRNGTPAPLGHRRPEEGVLTLAIARDGGAKLVVWTDQHPEPGFAILTDGSVAGFGFDNHFLGAATAKPIVDQLIATGEVHRAALGVWAQEVAKDDPIRRQHPELGASPAIRISDVQDGSPAARAGLARDDLILSIGDQPVGDAPTFAAVIAIRRGDTMLRVLRGSHIIELTVNLQPK